MLGVLTEPVRTENLKRVTYCSVQNEKGEQCSQALNITVSGTGSMINHVSANMALNLIYSRDSAIATSAPTERVFSKLGRVCAKERAHMNPIMVDALTQSSLEINVHCLPMHF